MAALSSTCSIQCSALARLLRLAAATGGWAGLRSTAAAAFGTRRLLRRLLPRFATATGGWARLRSTTAAAFGARRLLRRLLPRFAAATGGWARLRSTTAAALRVQLLLLLTGSTTLRAGQLLLLL